MNIFQFRDELIESYKAFSRSFTKIESDDIRNKVEQECSDLKRYWPDPLIQINPNYKQKDTVADCCRKGRLHPECEAIFQDKHGNSLRLFVHQDQAIDLAKSNQSYVVTTGTGSGKSLAFFIPIIDRILREKSEETNPKPRTRAIIIYPMNALANSQLEEIDKYLKNPGHPTKLTVGRYTSQELGAQRKELLANPPDILLTNYMMLELVLMRNNDRALVENCKGLEFLVLDELHTYRGRQGADVAMLVRRLRTQLNSPNMICIGTSATMSSVGSRDAQNSVVAKFASKIFGTSISPNQVISETLVPVTNPKIDLKKQKGTLHDDVVESANNNSTLKSYDKFKDNAFAVWLEQNLSITKERMRAMPLSVQSVVNKLASDAGVSVDQAERALKNFLAQFGTPDSLKMDNGRSPFAFKLHQFISGPGKVYVTLGSPGNRIITLDGQTYASDREEPNNKLPLFEAYFCRDCGQEYIPVWFVRSEGKISKILPRSINDLDVNETESFGYVCPATASQSYQGNTENLPDDWLDPKNPLKVRSTRRKAVPQLMRFSSSGFVSDDGEAFWVMPGKFKLCVNCMRTYTAQGHEKNRLIGLSGEGRSSTTTVMSLQILRQLYALPRNASDENDFRKLLGFSDNRQDTALQAGHFNDFLNQIVLRCGLVRALQTAQKPQKLNDIVNSICKSFHFDDPEDEQAVSEYLVSPENTKGRLFANAQTALHFSLSHKLLKDLSDRKLYTCPSLEALGLMRITYESLKELCGNDDKFAFNSVLRALNPSQRQELFTAFLDEIRRRQCIATRYFNAQEQNIIRDMDNNLLRPRWRLATDKAIPDGSAFVLDSTHEKAWSQGVPVKFTERSTLISFLGKLSFWKDIKDSLPVAVTVNRKDMHALVCEMTEILCSEGILRKTSAKTGVYYQLDQDAIEWNYPSDGEKQCTNKYFRDLYLAIAETITHDEKTLFEFEAQEHTAQVSNLEREELEMRFRAGKDDIEKWKKGGHNGLFKRLPVLFCSPTMELGIDISALNYVYMRNIPPTAANYVQRAGRAGRSGQQALSLSYCTALSPHDQWFFNHPEEMVQGVVKEPTLDLSNESLIKTHLHSIWMSAIGIELPSAVSQILDLGNENYPIKEELMSVLKNERITQLAVNLGRGVLEQVADELNDQAWYSPNYVDYVMQQAAGDFDRSFNGWRSLYKATRDQLILATEMLQRHGQKHKEIEIAKRRIDVATRQKELLESTYISTSNNDFYTYRYLASQGFLPGYNFPSLPLLAWVPDSADNDSSSTVLSRSRFLGLSEFGPRNVIYHRGHIFRIDRLKLSVSEGTVTAGNKLPTTSAFVCPNCGYAHVINNDAVFNVCENCGSPLSAESVIEGLYKVTMVETSEIERITIQDETRKRQGFDMKTLYRFAKAPNGQVLKETSEVLDNGKTIATLTYAPAASVWRVNLGWKYRINQKTKGFVINPISGYWRNDGPDSDENLDAEDKLQKSAPSQTIVPFVTDTRNILLFKPELDCVSAEDQSSTMATLQAALSRAIEQTYQIESSEIFVEPVPNTKNRAMLLIYESGEGGSGVLRDMIKNPEAISKIARFALKLMHYDIDKMPNLQAEELEQYDTKTDCINGCYTCLLTYYNQPDHALINRRDPNALRFLVALAHATAPTPVAGKGASEEKDNKATSPIERFKLWCAQNGFMAPDQTPKVFKRLDLTFDGAYSALRYCVSFTPIAEDELDTLEDFGWQMIDLSDESQWYETMRLHPELLSEG